MRLNSEQNHIMLNAVIYICSFLLFWEWLRPLQEITDTGSVFIFIVYTAFCFFLSYMQLQWWITSPLKLIGLLFILDGLFIQEGFLSKAWIDYLVADLGLNIQAIVSQQWWEMTALFRSLLFLILLWLMSYLLYYWFVIAKRTLFFVVLTFIYITVIDTFTVYDGKYAVMRAFLLSMVVLGLTSFQRLLVQEKIFRLPKERYFSWLFPLIFFVVFSSFIGFIAPKFSPQWPDPVPFIKSTAEGVSGQGSGPGIRKVGYGENDEQLGGAFVQDETLVFTAAVDDAQYWKVETKDLYTGKGWIRSEEGTFVVNENGTVVLKDFVDTVEVEQKNAKIAFNDQELLPKIVYPYGLTNVDIQDPIQLHHFKFNTESGEVFTELISSGNTIRVTNYSVEFDQPTFSLKALREGHQDDPLDIQQKYTQLPESLPQRVRDLAVEIVEGEENRYDMAKAIESYLNVPSRFKYETDRVAVPTGEEDYVDQFLFETQVGYCDNFSTSMVVLLRSLDIPARWVKGFGPGEEVEGPNGETGYEVTNSNAHSWVEVYFPEIGWVPFEPTPGFFNPTDFTSGVDIEDLLNSEDPEEDIPVSEMEKPELTEEDETGSAKSGSGDSFLSKVNWKLMGLIGIFLVLVGYYVYRKRYLWLTWIKLRQYKNKSDVETFIKAYKFLLALLASRGMKLKSDQTLREFAYQIDRYMQTNDMRRLTHHYELILYRGDQENGQWKQMNELWEKLIKKIMS
ncbi:transglutaminase-like putative cysteine protease [Salirhabdus euzebyi]|uniref:Transglutaminase-like putative cysteine protease n=1 Tax=Salirhabdus euzebyi TaxID=394506 RepID=A0A841Q8E7_9BACI|nr:transglutaminase domain-containing protein [Salirhabdus euzebyi]MBB6454879.1 transglutaminase-like putative cysteine protease [Salirhabdus euzebyi]